MGSKRRAAGEGTCSFDERRSLWVAQLPRAVDPKRRKVYGRTQREALGKLQEVRRDVERGLVVATGATKLSDWLDEWLKRTAARVRAGDLAPTTAVGYERAVRLYLAPELGRVPLRKLTPGQVQAVLDDLRGNGLAPATVRHVRATLSAALTAAMRDELVVRNVARLVDLPKLTRRRPSTFSVEEFRRIAAACSDDRLGPLFLFIARTGLRRSEALGLRWRSVDLEGGWFWVVEGLHQVSAGSERVVGRTGLVTGRPKTDASAASLPLSSATVTLLRDHRKAQATERLACPIAWPDDPDETHVFASTTGTGLHPSNVSRAWRRLLDRAEVEASTADGRARGLHELRRTFATRLRDAGVPLEDVQRLGRWSSSKMLLEVYAGSDDGRLRRAAEAAGEAMQ